MNDQLSLQLRETCLGARRVLLTGPIDPDGDSLGACLAIGRALRILGQDGIEVAGEVPYRYGWMPGADGLVSNEDVGADYDVVIVMDGDRHRLHPRIEQAFGGAGCRAIVDHHGTTTADGYDLCLLDARAASTTVMVREILRVWGVPLDPELAQLLYTGLVFDTGGFRHPNTNREVFHLAAELVDQGIDHATISTRVLAERRPSAVRLLARVLSSSRYLADGAVVLASVSQEDFGATGSDADDLVGIVETLVYTEGVEMACLCVERSAERVKLSLRSRTWVNVAGLASSLDPGGGGHARAAGVLLCESLDLVLGRLPEVLEETLANSARA
ncbi:MAG: DHH family phosphoesterase [Myxococcota bacterium]|jgi:phosphoesterase RecJ-like protein|nr:DHH family phosphoesterase [Myxococcota bacterium]